VMTPATAPNEAYLCPGGRRTPVVSPDVATEVM
jgi:hypothetical protein